MDRGTRIVDRLPELSELRRLRTARMLVVNLYFKEKLPDIPPEHVGLARSRGYLTFIDISQLWTSLQNNERSTDRAGPGRLGFLCVLVRGQQRMGVHDDKRIGDLSPRGI